MLSSLSSILSLSIETVHSSFIALQEARQQLVFKSTSLPSTFKVTGYDTPFYQDEVTQNVVSSLNYEQRAFPAQPDKTYYLEFADGRNTQVQLSLGDDAPEDVPTFTDVHGMAWNSSAPYLYEVLSPLVKENRARAVIFNLHGCGDSKATSPTFHHGGSTSDLGAVITWVTIKWPKGKVYVIGNSLGAVIAGNNLGQWGEECPVSAAALVSPVYDFPASCRAFVSRMVFNPAVGAFYAKLVKKNKDAFDIEHWTHTRPKPFPPSTPSTPSSQFSPPSIDSEVPQESLPLGQESRSGSFASSFSSKHTTSIFSSLPSPSTPGSSLAHSPLPGSSTFCLPSLKITSSSHVVTEHTPEIKEAPKTSLKRVTSRIIPQPVTTLRAGRASASRLLSLLLLLSQNTSPK